MDFEELGLKLKAVRLARRMNQREVGLIFNKSPAFISQFEHGHKSRTSLRTVRMVEAWIADPNYKPEVEVTKLSHISTEALARELISRGWKGITITVT